MTRRVFAGLVLFFFINSLCGGDDDLIRLWSQFKQDARYGVKFLKTHQSATKHRKEAELSRFATSRDNLEKNKKVLLGLQYGIVIVQQKNIDDMAKTLERIYKDIQAKPIRKPKAQLQIPRALVIETNSLNRNNEDSVEDCTDSDTSEESDEECTDTDTQDSENLDEQGDHIEQYGSNLDPNLRFLFDQNIRQGETIPLLPQSNPSEQ